MFLGRFFTIAWFYPHIDADISWQRWLGHIVLNTHRIPNHIGTETFTAPGASWVPQEWLFSTVLVALQSQYWIVAFFVAIVGASALFFIALRAKERGASEFAIAVTTTCVGFAMIQSFGVRAQIFGWALLAIIMLLLDMESTWKWLIVPLVILWANLHASAIIAPVIIGIWTFGIALEERAWTLRVRQAVLLTAATSLAICATPFLWHLLTYALALQTSSFRTSIAEWQPSSIIYPAVSIGLVPLLAICAWFGMRPSAGKTTWPDTLLFFFFSLLAFMAVRHLALAVIIIAPLAAQKLSIAFPSEAKVNQILRERFSQVLIYGSSAIATFFIAVMLATSPVIAQGTLPRQDISTLSDTGRNYRLYCQDFAWCSLGLGEPHIRVFLDGRCDPYPQRVWDDYLTVERGSSKWKSVLDKYRVNAVLVKRDTPLESLMRTQRNWTVFYRDREFEIFTR